MVAGMKPAITTFLVAAMTAAALIGIGNLRSDPPPAYAATSFTVSWPGYPPTFYTGTTLLASAPTGELAGRTCTYSVTTDDNDSIHNNTLEIRSATTGSHGGYESSPGVFTASGTITLSGSVEVWVVTPSPSEKSSLGGIVTVTCPPVTSTTEETTTTWPDTTLTPSTTVETGSTTTTSLHVSPPTSAPTTTAPENTSTSTPTPNSPTSSTSPSTSATPSPVPVCEDLSRRDEWAANNCAGLPATR